MEKPPSQSRRDFLKKAAFATAGLALASTLPGCEPPMPEMLFGKVADLDAQGSLEAEFNGNLVLALRDQSGAIALFSLVCSHKRCTVAYQPELQEFHCPCHEGKYNREGYVISGPPPGPLRRYQHEIRGEELWIINKSA